MIPTIPIQTHGGDIQRVAREYGLPPAEVLDFSANINPRGLPPEAAKRLAREASDPALLMKYPDPEARELREALSCRLDIPINAIVIGGGAGALIMAVIRALQPRHTLIPVPAFHEYAHACASTSCAVEYFRLVPKDAFAFDREALSRAVTDNAPDLLIINNPHNPSGSLTDSGTLRHLLGAASAAGADVLVDEAFIDYAPGAEITREAARRPGLIAVRSFTKFYGCPALRVGYAVASPDIAKRIAAQLPPWPVTTLALNAMVEALKDEAYARATLEENERERVKLSQALRHLGLHVFPSATNFLLLRLPENCSSSAELQERLIVRHRILIRNCDSFEGLEKGRYIRLAVRRERENNRLVEAMSKSLR